MNNRYFIVRHSYNQANEMGIVVSKLEIGIPHYGLTKKGKKQVQTAAQSHPLGPETIIYSSDFLRAKETAEILKRIWNCGDILYAKELMNAMKKKTIALASHGDSLQILQTRAKRPPSEHKALPHLENAEIRKLRASDQPLFRLQISQNKGFQLFQR